MKKRLLTVFLAMMMVFVLAACGKEDDDDDRGRDRDRSESVSSRDDDDDDDDDARDKKDEKDSAEPDGGAESGDGTYASLKDWVNSSEKDDVCDEVNAQLATSGLTMDLYAEGDVLVMEYTSTSQADLSGMSQSEIDAVFRDQLAPVLLGSGEEMKESFQTEYGLAIADIKVVILNADGTEVFSGYGSDMINTGGDAAASGEDDAIAAWCASDDARQLENSINSIYSPQGLDFYVAAGGPGTIIYDYRYQNVQFAGMSDAEIISRFETNMDDSAVAAIQGDIAGYQSSYGLPVTSILTRYWNADGTLVYYIEIDKNGVVDSSAGASAVGVGDGSYATLKDWVNSSEKDEVCDEVNRQLAASGLTMDLYVEKSDILVMEYTSTSQTDTTGMKQSEIDAIFKEQLAPVLMSSGEEMLEAFRTGYGLEIADIKVVILNADGTELFSGYGSELLAQ